MKASADLGGAGDSLKFASDSARLRRLRSFLKGPEGATRERVVAAVAISRVAELSAPPRLVLVAEEGIGHRGVVVRMSKKRKVGVASEDGSADEDRVANEAVGGEVEVITVPASTVSSVQLAQHSTFGEQSQNAPKARRAEGTKSKRNTPNTCEWCGSSTHNRKDAEECPKYQSSSNSSTQRSQNRETQKSGAHVDGDWTPLPCPDEYSVLWEDDVRSLVVDPRVKAQLDSICEKLRARSVAYGFEEPQLNMLSIFRIIGERLVKELFKKARDILATQGEPPLNLAEFWEFLAVLVVHQCVGTKDFALELLRVYSNGQYGLRSRLNDLSEERFTKIQRAITMMDPETRSETSDAPSASEETDSPTTFDETDAPSASVETDAPTSISLHDSVNVVNDWEDIEKLAFADTRSVALSQHTCLVLDDKLVGTRASDLLSHAVSNKEAGEDELDNNACADALHPLVYSIRHHRRVDWSQRIAVNQILDDLRKHSGDNISCLFAADRGYSKRWLWESLALRNFSFCMISGVDGNPWRARSTLSESELADSQFRHDVVDDGPRMGQQIFAMKRSVQMSRDGDTNKKDIHAFAFVEFQASEEKESRVIRYVECGTGHGELMRSTLVLVPRPESDDAVRSSLFFPQTKVEQRKTDIETKVSERAIPLTRAQGGTDWFILRMFCITGTSGGKLALLDPEARNLLRDDSNAALIETPIEKVALDLACSWVSSRNLSRPDMRTGTINEDNVFKSLKNPKTKWCEAIFACGLFQSRHNPGIAVSPDAIARVQNPEAPASSQSVLCSVVIKTRVTPGLVNAAYDVRVYMNSSYFSCVVSDSVWWKAVAPEHRAQVIHQALVLDLDHVLYVVATPRSLVYSCLVHVPEDARLAYRRALQPWTEKLTAWAHMAIETSGPPPSPPDYFDEHQRKVLSSHFRLWRALRKRVAHDGPMSPVHVIKCVPQVVYNVLKGGVDGSTQFVQDISGASSLELSVDQSFVIRTFDQVFVNAAILYRLQAVHNHAADLEGLHDIRARANRLMPVNSCAFSLFRDILEYCTTLPGGSTSTKPSKLQCTLPSIDRASAQKICRKRPRRAPKLQRFFNEGPALQVRLDKSLEHIPVPLGRPTFVKRGVTKGREKPQQATCVMCFGLTTKCCSICDVPLHVRPLKGTRKSCLEKFHTQETLDILAHKKARERRINTSGPSCSGAENGISPSSASSASSSQS